MTLYRAKLTKIAPTINILTSLELVKNGTFDTDSDWFKGGGWSISGGKAIFITPVGPGWGNVSQGLSFIVAGETYRVIYTIVRIDADSIRFSLGNVWSTLRNATGTYIEDITATVTTGSFYFRPYNIGTTQIEIDNISVTVKSATILRGRGSLDYEIHAADSAMELYDNVVAGSAKHTGTLTDTDGRGAVIRTKTVGGWIGVVLRNDTINESFSVEKISGNIIPAGRMK